MTSTSWRSAASRSSPRPSRKTRRPSRGTRHLLPRTPRPLRTTRLKPGRPLANQVFRRARATRRSQHRRPSPQRASRRSPCARSTRLSMAIATSSSPSTQATAGRTPARSVATARWRKNVVLAIARALAKRINAEPGMRAVLTRDDDYFVVLRDRMVRARNAKADLFVSVHADSIRGSKHHRRVGVRALRAWRQQRSGALARGARERGGPRGRREARRQGSARSPPCCSTSRRPPTSAPA